MTARINHRLFVGLGIVLCLASAGLAWFFYPPPGPGIALQVKHAMLSLAAAIAAGGLWTAVWLALRGPR
ncbi:MAG: hypothetical protein EOO54_23615 [Haliea sp.]|nr:MAG: hypothetical protein EOO54_23615 [Haliea sp.]